MHKYSFFTEKAYQKMKYFFAIGFIIILIVPWFKQINLCYWIDGFYFLFLGEWLVTALQRRKNNIILSILIGYLAAFVVTIIALFYSAAICSK